MLFGIGLSAKTMLIKLFQKINLKNRTAFSPDLLAISVPVSFIVSVKCYCLRVWSCCREVVML